MNNENHVRIQSMLKEILENVNNWLTFAEAKNAAIIAFNIAGISTIWSADYFKEEIVLVYLVSVGMLVSTIVALLSFIPQMGKVNKNIPGRHEDDNEILKIEEDYAEEITYNAMVTVRKYQCFTYALRIEIVALVVLGITVIIA